MSDLKAIEPTSLSLRKEIGWSSSTPAAIRMKCPLCGNQNQQIVQTEIRDLEYGAPGEYRWLKCTDCGIVRQDPFPTPETFSEAYPPHYNAYAKPKSRLLGYLAGLSRKRQAKYILQWLPKNGSILDIGCSTGELLSQIGALGNFKLHGSEYSAAPAAIARSRGFHVWQGDFETAEIPKSGMDTVVMNHVLEHVVDCVNTLKRIEEILKPGGYLIGEVPNIDSWDGRLFGKYWGGTHAPRHIWHLSPNTLRKAIEKSGLEVVTIETNPRSGHFWALSMQNWLRRNRNNLKDLISGRTWYYPIFLVAGIPLHLLQGWISQGGIISFVARKPSK